MLIETIKNAASETKMIQTIALPVKFNNINKPWYTKDVTIRLDTHVFIVKKRIFSFMFELETEPRKRFKRKTNKCLKLS